MKRNTIIWIVIISLILLLFLFNRLLAIWLTLLFLVIKVISYTNSLTFKKKLLRAIQKYSRITDEDVAEKLEIPLKKIRKKLSKICKHKKRKGLSIVFLSNRYIIYNQDAVNEFRGLYNNGVNEKEIFENLKVPIGFKTRAEVKAIKDTLINHKKVEKIENTSDIKDQIRKSEIY